VLRDLSLSIPEKMKVDMVIPKKKKGMLRSMIQKKKEE
jgi:hypothetical protein